ncbi:MAG: hypothetical protein AB4042_12870, partial [Leptolyngbyaceae cyanobacterium]
MERIHQSEHRMPDQQRGTATTLLLMAISLVIAITGCSQSESENRSRSQESSRSQERSPSQENWTVAREVDAVWKSLTGAPDPQGKESASGNHVQDGKAQPLRNIHASDIPPAEHPDTRYSDIYAHNHKVHTSLSFTQHTISPQSISFSLSDNFNQNREVGNNFFEPMINLSVDDIGLGLVSSYVEQNEVIYREDRLPLILVTIPTISYVQTTDTERIHIHQAMNNGEMIPPADRIDYEPLVQGLNQYGDPIYFTAYVKSGVEPIIISVYPDFYQGKTSIDDRIKTLFEPAVFGTNGGVINPKSLEQSTLSSLLTHTVNQINVE